MPGMETLGVDSAEAPIMQSGGGSYFSQDLGTILRLRYNTESYGQTGHGNFDVGTMQVVSFDDSVAFFDGQVTMNEVQGVGFNLGLGYRWMHYPPLRRGLRAAWMASAFGPTARAPPRADSSRSSACRRIARRNVGLASQRLHSGRRRTPIWAISRKPV